MTARRGAARRSRTDAMPTGYTAGVADGEVKDLRTFALRCARQFGATIMQRDESMESLPRLRDVSPHYAQQRAKAEARVLELRGMTEEEAERVASAQYDRSMKEYEQSRANREVT